MRRILGFLFLLPLFLLALPPVFASDDGTVLLPPSPTPVRQVEYELPYPGLLPDHPLYVFKTARDRLIGMLISDPFKKASFDLLQAEKRFQSGLMLFQEDEKKKDLALTTLSKGQNYLDEAIATAAEAKAQKKEIGDFPNKIRNSIRKQQELLRDVARTHPSIRGNAAGFLKNLDKSLEKVNDIFPTG
jgi:hypothetical protein